MLDLHINGAQHSISVDDPDMPLLYALRNDVGLHGPKFGCGLGQCGACTVLMDGKAVRSCQVPVTGAVGKEIVTLEGLGTAQKPDPVQAAFIHEQAAQCGYCTNGMIMQTRALLKQVPNPTEADIRSALDGNLCRCGTHVRIIRAVQRAAVSLRSGG